MSLFNQEIRYNEHRSNKTNFFDNRDGRNSNSSSVVVKGNSDFMGYA